MNTHNADTARTFPSRTAHARHTVPAWIPDGSAVAVIKRKRAFGYCRVSTDMHSPFLIAETLLLLVWWRLGFREVPAAT